MAEQRSKPDAQGVARFLQSIPDPQKRADCQTLLTLMQELTGEEPMMWGDAMVGFGTYHYKYASGREGDWFVTGFSPRARNISIYIMAGFTQFEDLLLKLGKHKTGKSCLYIKALKDVDLSVLRELLANSIATFS